MKTIFEVKGTFKGLYEWGKGWNIEKKQVWDRFWKGSRGIFWKFFQDENGSQYLVSTCGSLFLHPMGFDAVLFTSCGNGINLEIDELLRLCLQCSDMCNGTFELTSRKIVEQ